MHVNCSRTLLYQISVSNNSYLDGAPIPQIFLYRDPSLEKKGFGWASRPILVRLSQVRVSSLWRSSRGDAVLMGVAGAGERQQAGGRGLLGAVVRALPDDPPHNRRHIGVARGEAQLLRAQHGREPRHRHPLRHPQHPHGPLLQERREEGRHHRGRAQGDAPREHRETLVVLHSSLLLLLLLPEDLRFAVLLHEGSVHE